MKLIMFNPYIIVLLMYVQRWLHSLPGHRLYHLENKSKINDSTSYIPIHCHVADAVLCVADAMSYVADAILCITDAVSSVADAILCVADAVSHESDAMSNRRFRHIPNCSRMSIITWGKPLALDVSRLFQ